MICRTVIKRYTETIELLIILVNLVCWELKLNYIIDINFVLQFYSNGLKAEPSCNRLFDVNTIMYSKRTMTRLV